MSGGEPGEGTRAQPELRRQPEGALRQSPLRLPPRTGGSSGTGGRPKIRNGNDEFGAVSAPTARRRSAGIRLTMCHCL